MGVETLEGFIGIHQSFAETEMGAVLASRVRYERYKPSNVSNERWQELLGADVNNLEHMPLTYGLTRVVARHLREGQPGLLDQREEDVLQIAALIHDWGEAVIGDITYEDKTAADEDEEMQHLSGFLDQLYGDSSDQIKDLVKSAAEVVKDPTSKLGHVFNTVERLGYLRTALRAASHVEMGTASDCENGFRWIVADVLRNQIIALLSRRDLYLPVVSYLDSQKSAISCAFALVRPDIFENYPLEQRDQKISEFKTTLAAWELYCGPT